MANKKIEELKQRIEQLKKNNSITRENMARYKASNGPKHYQDSGRKHIESNKYLIKKYREEIKELREKEKGMGKGIDAFKRELGKNTGKWVSNKVFGDGHATPHKIISSRQRENARKELVEARNYREQQKQIERERKEREKRLLQLEKESAEKERQQMIDNNLSEIEDHNNYINVIQSVHKDFSKEMDWQEILDRKKPEYIGTSIELEDKIIEETNTHIEKQIKSFQRRLKPSIFKHITGRLYHKKYAWVFKVVSNKTFFTIVGFLCFFGLMYSTSLEGFMKYFLSLLSVLLFISFWFIKKSAKEYNDHVLVEEKVKDLENRRVLILKENKEKQDILHEQYIEEMDSLEKIQKIAKGVLNKDSKYYTYAINFFNPFEDLKEYGSDISVNVDTDIIYVDFFVHGEEVIPNTIKKSVRKGAEIKEEKMPISRFNEIYQDYVCSCVLRIAKELFQLLPMVNSVQVNAKGSIMNTATGNHDEQTIVSSLILRSKLNELNFELLDPSDSMSNFKHNMVFKKSMGFKPVEVL